MNNLIISGRLTADPQKNASGKVVTFTVAVDRNFGGDEQQTDFINVKMLGEKTADNVCKYFHKGKPIILIGEMRGDQYEKDGQKLTYWHMLANRFEFVLADKDNNKGGATISGTDLIGEALKDAGFSNLADDDMPF